MCIRDSNYSALRQRVIDLSLEQINEHTSLEVSYEPMMKGRATVGIEFKIKAKTPPEQLEKEEKKAEINQRLEAMFQSDIADIISYASNQLSQFYPSFSQHQKKTILTDTQKLKDFLRADLYVDYGYADINPEAYVAQSVFNYKGKNQE